MPRLILCVLGEARPLLPASMRAFQLVLTGARGPDSRTVGRLGWAWRVALTEPIRCSRARRDALVSRAKRGVNSCLTGLNGVDGGIAEEDSIVDEELLRWERPSLPRICTDFGAPRATGCLTNLDSVVAEVGKSSNTSSSLPSPKALRRVGLVSVRLEAASRARDSGATSLRPVGVVGRWCTLDKRDNGRLSEKFSLESEEFGRL